MALFAAGAAAGAAAAAVLLGIFQLGRRRRLGRFFSFAAHEINTPITALNMTVLNFVSGVFGEIPAEQKPWFDILREQVVRLNAMLGELRDVIHLEFERDLQVSLEETDASDVLRRALEGVAHGFAQAGAAVRAEVAPGLPKIAADEERFFRVLIELLHHARKFKAKGDVSLCARAVPPGVVIEIAYPCLPLSPEEARRSLELFYPADVPIGAFAAAAGLGLGAARELTRRQGGDLSLTIGQGPTATLRLEMLDWAGRRKTCS